MRILFFALISSLLFVSCEGPRKVTSQNHAYLYNKNLARIHPQFKIYHTKDTESQLDFLIDATELMYMKGATDTLRRANIYIQVILHSTFESTEILDSTSTKLTDISDGKNEKYIHGEIKFKASYPNTYYLQVLVTDLNRKSSYKDYLFVNKSNHFNTQNFRVFSAEGREFFGNDIGPKDKIQIEYNNPNQDKYTVKYYKGKFHLPSPVFSLNPVYPSFNAEPDSTFIISGSGNTYSFPREGLYLIQSDASQQDGLCVLRFYDGFPDVTNADVLVNALRYVTDKNEFGKLHSASNKKEAVDKFWLDLAGNEDRARELISKYYNRVQDANRYFTSYTEGWRTDRGMVYLIFGPPISVYKTGSSESWVYGERNGATPTTFIFVHNLNAFSQNDYRLRRDATLKGPWYRAVEAWRQGKLYSE